MGRRAGYGATAKSCGALGACSVLYVVPVWPGLAAASVASLALLGAAYRYEHEGQRHVGAVLSSALGGWHPYSLQQIAPRIQPGQPLAPPFPYVEHPRTIVVGELGGRPALGAAGTLYVAAPGSVVDVVLLAWSMVLCAATFGRTPLEVEPETRRGLVTWIAVQLDEAASALPDFTMHPRRGTARQWIDDLFMPSERFESIELDDRFDFVVARPVSRLRLWRTIDPVAIEHLSRISDVRVRKLRGTLLVAQPGGAMDEGGVGELVAIQLELLRWLDGAAGASGIDAAAVDA